MTELEQYRHATRAIFSMAVAEQKKINANTQHGTKRIKAYRIALAFLCPDLTSEEIYNEIERASRYEWNAERREYEEVIVCKH